MFKIEEGLVRNALNDLILPTLSIDEYESKISDKRAIVVGFYVEEELPARDLSNFIDRSGHAVLDTEVSPAPTPEGQFMVFVEFERNGDFPKALIDVLDEVENITNVNRWQFHALGNDSPMELSPEVLKKHLTLDPDDIIDDVDGGEDLSKDDVALSEFWKSATVGSFLLEENLLVIDHFGSKYHFELVDQLDETAAIIPDDATARNLQRLLGNAYSVFATNNGLIVENGFEQRFIKSLDT